jgi:glycosyltransferase involved in cell wall biosynthesis
MSRTTPLRILNLVHQYLPEFVGGTELYTQSISRSLAQSGHEIGIFHRAYQGTQGLTPGSDGDIQLFSAVSGTFSPAQRFLSTFRHPQLHQYWIDTLDRFQPQLVHVQHLMGLPASLLDVLVERKIPYVVTLLDYWWLCANANLLTNYDQRACEGPNHFLNCTRCAIARSQGAAWLAAPMIWTALATRTGLLQRLMAQAHALLAPSTFVNSWYASHGAPIDNLRTLQWGVILPESGVPAHSGTQPVLRLLYVGGLAPNKGVHILLEAFRQLKGQVQLIIAGDPTTHPEYAERLRSLATPGVIFAGRLDRQQVWQALAEADCVLIPSLWHETFCLVAHEALAAGTPVVASQLGALTEAVHPEVDGLLVEAGNVDAWRGALQRLVDDPTLVARLQQGIQPPTTLDDHVSRLLTIYREAIETRR